ncbi:MAG: Hsp70 family protein [Pirellulales bacterium]|nr:Hsp70 family protein [Pirellulales bacterium]
MNASNASGSEKLQPPVGIDLGTTLSAVAYIDASGRPTTIPNRSGDLLTPSAVAFEEGVVVVGKEAIKGSVLTPGSFAECFKRDMGRGKFHRPISGEDVPPEVCSAFLLARLKEDAEHRIGPIRQVVITVPAFFDEGRRKATQDAGRLAGLEVLDIINEPTAAAVSYGYHRTVLGDVPNGNPYPKERLLVYDLGGGTFDVTILDIDGGTFRTVATDGDVQLGGKDFDERLIDYLAENFKAEHGLDPRSDPEDSAQLWIDAQEAKHALSERQKTTVVCYHAGIRMRQEITRAKFEELTQDLLGRTESTMSLVVKEAGLNWTNIDRILLIGGSTRMPAVEAMIRRVTNKEPDRSQSPDEAVAHGAALYARMLMGRQAAAGQSEIELVNVNSHSLGVVGINPKTGERVNAIVIPKNTPLPCCKVKKFQTAQANQPDVMVSVVEGESRRPEHCIALGECVIRDLPPGLPQGARIEVEYQYAANGRLSVSARVPSTRQSAHVTIERKRKATVESLDAWRNRLCGISISGGIPGGSSGEQSAAGDKELGFAEPEDRAGLRKRLDEFYTRLGELAVTGVEVPDALEASLRSARDAVERMKRIEAARKKALQAQESAMGATEASRAASDAAAAGEAFEHAKKRARFACLVLGRECIDVGVTAGEFEKFMPEIVRLRHRLGD